MKLSKIRVGQWVIYNNVTGIVVAVGPQKSNVAIMANDCNAVIEKIITNIPKNFVCLNMVDKVGNTTCKIYVRIGNIRIAKLSEIPESRRPSAETGKELGYI